MGILNCTPDSFYDGGTHQNINNQLDHLVNEGTDIIDIGGQSTRPKAELIDEKQEWQRIRAAIEYGKENYPELIISVDTFYSEVAGLALENGVHIINDISGGQLDQNMYSVVSQYKAPYVMMHMKGTPQNMVNHTDYENLILEMTQFFNSRINEVRSKGVHDIIIDPGFGFAKNLDQNFHLLNHLKTFNFLECPILVGVSRKSMIYKSLNIEAEDALNGTTSLNTIALLNGANILRVHDVKEARQCKILIEKYQQNA